MSIFLFLHITFSLYSPTSHSIFFTTLEGIFLRGGFDVGEDSSMEEPQPQRDIDSFFANLKLDTVVICDII